MNGTPNGQSCTAPAADTSFPIGRKRYVLGLLFLVYTFNYVDRQILVILAEPIKHEFDLKDWQLGFLTGPSFALFYATMGIPIARLADRWNRVYIIASALAAWSAMTAVCAAAGSFVQLAAARVGVGIGEGGGGPPAISLLASYFKPLERATAMGVYSLGATVGTLIGFVIGGWVDAAYGWRAAILAVSLPGLGLAALIRFTVPETRVWAADVALTNVPDAPMLATFRELLHIRTYRLLVFAAVAAGIAVYAFMVWVPVYLIRRFGLSTREIGTAFGLIAGTAGSLGVFLGGYLPDRLSRGDRRWQMRLPAMTTALFVPMTWLALHAPTKGWAFAMVVPAYALALAYTGPTWAVLQTVTPAHRRAMAAALAFLLVNLIGLGLGPQLVGILSDVLPTGPGARSLGDGISIVVLASFGASACFALGARSLVRDTDVQVGNG